jgi:hypothetical protein
MDFSHYTSHLRNELNIDKEPAYSHTDLFIIEQESSAHGGRRLLNSISRNGIFFDFLMQL